MTGRTEEQRSIVEWFDATYARKGARYLRPLEAYLVFPVLLGANARDRLLDVACGTGLLLKAMSDHTERLHGCDVSSVAVARARTYVPRARVVVGNAEALPYGDATFDLLTCLGSLERMLDRRKALAEMLRVGVPGARYCFMVRNSNTRAWRYRDRVGAREPSRGHADADTEASWRQLFESAGFRVARVLPDQYPLMRGTRWRGLFLRRVDFRVEIEAREPLERANEFIFILEKRR